MVSPLQHRLLLAGICGLLLAASGAALGRLAGTLGKLLVAVVVWVLLVVAAFVP